MAGEAVSFGVTRHARFEILAGGLTVANNERLFRVMIPGPQGAISGESCRNMTGRTERSGIVTIAARGFPRVGGGRVGHKESLTVVPSSRIAGRWAMTVQTVLSGMTPRTRGGDSGRIRTVQVPKAKVVGSGGCAFDGRSLPPPGPGYVEVVRNVGGGYVAGDAALPRVTRRAIKHVRGSGDTMLPEEIMCVVIVWRLEYGHVDE